MLFVEFSSRRFVLGSAILLAGFLAGPLAPGHAEAHYSTCRADPKVFLSNGSVVTLSATIADSAADVKSIQYTLHAPAGTSVTGVVYTGGSFADKETFTFYADGAAGSYDSDTVVTIDAGNIAVTAATQVSNPSLSGSFAGYNSQVLAVHLTDGSGRR